MGTVALGAGIDRRCKRVVCSRRTRELPQELEPRAGKHRRWLSLCRGHVAIGASVSGPFQEMTGEGLFVALVIIAVVTTLMGSPLFDRLVGSERTRVRPLREA